MTRENITENDRAVIRRDVAMYVGNGAKENASTTNGNTKITISDGSDAGKSIGISGGDGILVSSNTTGNVIIDAATVDEILIPSVELVKEYLRTHPACRWGADWESYDFKGTMLNVVAADSLLMGSTNVYNYFAGNYDGGIRVHCPVFHEGQGLPDPSDPMYPYVTEYNTSGFDPNDPFKARYEETGIVLCGSDNKCMHGRSPRTWVMQNNGGHLSIARSWNHGTPDIADFLRCESEGCNSDYHPRPEEDPSAPARKWIISSDLHVVSDRRLKDNIQPMSDDKKREIWSKAEDIIRQFTLNRAPNETVYGVIAQEIEEIIPDAVTTTSGYKTVDYNSIYGALIGTLMSKVKELEEKVAQLEARV